MHKPALITVLFAALFLGACTMEPEQSRAVPVEVPTNPDGSPVTGVLTAEYDPGTGVLPTPNNLAFVGSQDGTLNIPVADPGDFTDPLVALNALDGFSTVAPMSTTFSSAVNPGTVVPGASVRVFEVTLCDTDPCPPVAGPPDGIVGELVGGQDFVALINPTDVNQRQLLIVPLRPLNAKSHYLVVITNGVADPDGNAAGPSQIYSILKRTDPLVDGNGNSTDPLLSDADAQALEPLRQLVNAQESVALSAGIARSSIAVSWTVSTQSTRDVMDFVAGSVESAAHNFTPTGLTTTDFNAALPGFADVYVGTIDVDYALQAPDDDPLNPDPTRILSGHWTGAGGSNLTRFNPAVVPLSEQTLPALLTVPNATSPGFGAGMPVTGWPIAIFQHGITGDRSNMLGMADALAAAGFAVIAIDQPLHGITDESSPLYAASTDPVNNLYAATGNTTNERTFDVDLVDNATGAPGPDGNIDGSGAHTINLQRLLTSRDNLRQAAADILTIVATVPDLTTQVVPNAFDETRIHFVGHSLGAMVGTIAVASDGTFAASTLGMPGGGIARLLDGSATFGPVIRAGLQAAGVAPDSPEFNAFLFAAQTVVDAADPINFGAAAADNAAIHLVEVVGDGTEDNLPDQVVPNSVPGHPLSGTEPLAAVMGLQSVSVTTIDAAGLRGIVRFTEGDHSSLLSPAGSLAAFLEMQHQMGFFAGSSGTVIDVDDEAVVQ